MEWNDNMDLKKILKYNYKFLLFIILLCLFFYLKLPYYVMAPGGTINITDRVNLSGYEETNGSINMLYVSEYKATPGLYLYSMIMGYDIIKNNDRKISNESIKEVEDRNKIMRDNSLDVALMVAYTKANKFIKINNKRNVIIATTQNNGLKVGDIILEVDNTLVEDVSAIKKIINNKKENDIITFKILRDGKEKEIKSKIYLENNTKIVGVVIITDYDYEIEPKLEIKFRDSESGSSGGLMLTLTIYNALVNEDIIKGRKISGTGTISFDGSVGEIDGIKYKIMGAASDKMDIVFVPSSNYEEAIATKNKYHYDMDIIKVDTFDEVLDYLKK